MDIRVAVTAVEAVVASTVVAAATAVADTGNYGLTRTIEDPQNDEGPLASAGGSLFLLLGRRVKKHSNLSAGQDSCRSDLAADLPVVPKGINDATDAPSVALGNGVHNLGAGGAGPCKQCVGGRVGNQHAKTRSFKSLWAEIAVLRRFIAHPEL